MPLPKRALITGVTGQDGSYLAELLLDKGYTVHGLIRRSSSFNTSRIDHLLSNDALQGRFVCHHADMTEGSRLRTLIDAIEPDEIYHLAAQSHVKVSFSEPEFTLNVIAMGSVRLFEAVRDHCEKVGRAIRVYNAGSSEMFGSAPAPQDESTVFHPRSPYAVSKVAAHWLAVNARESYGLFIANGVLFNHESPRRGETFVTRKITRAVGRIAIGTQKGLVLGNLNAERDWGFAGDYVDAMWRIVQQPKADDFVIATGESHSVRQFLAHAFGHVGLRWEDHVTVDPRYFRPAEVDALCGDASKAQRDLGWRPSTGFEALVGLMVDHDLDLAMRERDAGVR
ncbi:MAG: GDP-mannose 4,6-dehydratase [Gemmatimonadetes bacterium]|nr:GDP-mannose 4,6-dehydratase [Gemmatimonadota bacterium]